MLVVVLVLEASAVEASVANDLEELEMNDRETCRKGGAFRHLNLVTVAAIMST